MQFDDGTYSVIDFKTSTPRATHLEFYGRQLRAYALEHPAPGKYSLSPITHLRLLVVEPATMHKMLTGQVAYLGKVTWQEISPDEAAFLAFLDAVLTVLELPDPPPAAANCAWCQYRTSST